MNYLRFLIFFLICACQSKKKDETAAPSTIMKYCGDSRVRQIQRPISPGSPTQFTYKYFFQPSASPDLPVIVSIPGGPGQAGIASNGLLEQDLKSYPTGFGVLATDPRGVGCNFTGDNQPGEFYSSDLVAEDIALAIKDVGLTNYVVYGVSYGTVVSTILSTKIESANLPAPKAIVLEGTLSKILGPETNSLYSTLWDEILNAAPSEAQSRFRSENYPFGDTAGWTQLIASLLRVGLYESKTTYFNILSRVLELSVSTQAEQQAIARDIYKSITEDKDSNVPGFSNFYGNIACTEIWESLLGTELKAGKISAGTVNLCKKYADSVKAKPNPFDHKRYLSSAKYVYVQGKKDPATPYVQARNHFLEQSNAAEKTWIEVARGGHNLLGISIEKTCTGDFWNSLKQTSPQESLLIALKKCRTPGLNVDSVSRTNPNIASTSINADMSSAYSLIGDKESEIDMKDLKDKIRQYRIPKF